MQFFKKREFAREYLQFIVDKNFSNQKATIAQIKENGNGKANVES